MLFYTIFLVAMFTAIILIPPLTYLYNKLDLVDMPSARKVHTVPIPRVGGVAIVIASMIPVVWWLELDISLISLVVAVFALFVLGIIDDVKNISYKVKFVIQIISIALIFIFGFIDFNSSYFISNQVLLGPILFAIYFVFILGVTNAINLADGLDGLAGGEALLSFSIIGLLAYEINNMTILFTILAVVGSVFGFLRFNTYPAKIFMGDTGSLFLGFILGVLSIALTYGADNAFAKTLPLLLVGLPIFDTLMVIVIRISNRQSPFNADRNHLHHKLLDNGYKHYQSVLVIYLIQSIYVLAAYNMRYETDLNIIIAFLVISALSYLISRITVNSKSIIIKFEEINIYISHLSKKYIVKYSDKLFITISILMFAYVIMSITDIKNLDIDILVLLTLITLLAVYGLIFLSAKPCTWMERIAIHVMVVMSIYFGSTINNSLYFNIIHIGFISLSVFLILVLVFADKNKRFVGSPLDFLLIATAMVIPNLPNSPLSGTGLSALLIELLVLFYCIEYLLFNIKNNWWSVRTTLGLCASVPIFINFL